MRDPRFPSHAEVKEAILGWASNGEPYTGEELRSGLAEALEVAPELQRECFTLSSTMTKWENYVAHGLAWHTRDGIHEPGDDRYYRLTERGRTLASQFVAQK
jgi:hypothetical protein